MREKGAGRLNVGPENDCAAISRISKSDFPEVVTSTHLFHYYITQSTASTARKPTDQIRFSGLVAAISAFQALVQVFSSQPAKAACLSRRVSFHAGFSPFRSLAEDCWTISTFPANGALLTKEMEARFVVACAEPLINTKFGH